jgi:hypothetical protein
MRLAAITCGILVAGCGVCRNNTDADGIYDVTSNCTGTLIRGKLTIGQLPLCQYSPDAGHSLGSDGGTHDNSTCTQPTDTCSGTTTATGVALLGLPSTVEVYGLGNFGLLGDVGGRKLVCTPASFGDEQILVCRENGRVVCSAVVANK